MRGTGVGRDQRLRKEGIESSREESTPQKEGIRPSRREVRTS